MNSRHIEILNAVFTPMLDSGEINLKQVPVLYQQFLETGSQGVFLNGTTGECMSLSMAERNQLVEAWVTSRQAGKSMDVKIIVHVGSCNLFEAAQMAKHSQELGVDGIAMVSTFYFRPKSLEELVGQCAYVAASAPETPFYYYNIPSLTGVNFPLIDFISLAGKTIPTFAGLKNSFTDMVDYQHCLHQVKKKYSLYWGTDEAFMMLYVAGNRHYVGSTYNYMSSYYTKMVQAHRAGNLEEVIALQGEADSIYRILNSYNGIVAGKEIMRMTGIDCGPVRIPLSRLSAQQSGILFNKLNSTGFFQHVLKNLKPLHHEI